MKVHELIEILQDMDPEADVYVMAQESWPYAERCIMRSCTPEAGHDVVWPRLSPVIPRRTSFT
jgi:hypothetical protein